MATQRYLLKVALLFYTIYSCYAADIFDRILDDTSSCTASCKNKFLVRNVQIDLNTACERGCRLYTIIEFASDNDEKNNTVSDCEGSCKEAYHNSQLVDACNTGCQSQRPYSLQKSTEEAELPSSIHVLYPVMMIHSVYSTMMKRVSHSFTWTFYVQRGNSEAGLVMVETGPERQVDLSQLLAENGGHDEYKTSNYLETNLRSLDDSATPDFTSYPKARTDSQQSPDWLTCVSKKTGLPRLLLSFTLLLSAIVMIWLCLSSAATAPDHNVAPQKLSLYGDMDVLRYLKNEGLQHCHPQDGAVNYGPLPVKIAVEKV